MLRKRRSEGKSRPRPSAVDATHNVASLDELRRRAAEGDQRAGAELARRGSMLVGVA